MSQAIKELVVRLSLIFISFVMNTAVFAQSCPPGSSACSGTYVYDGMGNIRAIGADTYIYDTAGRLVSGTADMQRTGILSRQDYSYDAFGNRTSASRITGSVDCLGGCEQSPAIDPVTNHITGNGAVYDAAGNLISITNTVNSTSFTSTYDYDSAGNMTRATAGSDVRQFTYTADGERIGTRNGQSWTWTIRDLDNKVLREFTSLEPNGSPGLPTTNRQWSKDYVWRDGLLLASVSASASGPNITEHFHLDHLGTPRMVSNDAGVQVGVHAYYPFGAELNLSPETPVELMKFTGHERDQLASNPNTLDYMHARYETGTMGRFLSVDPMRGDTHHPQSWNRYLYVGNQPVNNIDPKGLCTFTLTGGEKYSDENTVCVESTARNPSDLEYRMTMANIAAVENLHYLGMFADWVAREFSAPYLKFGQSLLNDKPGPLISGVFTTGMVAVGAIGGPEEEAAAELGQLGTDVTVTFSKQAIGHGERHLAGTGLTGEAVEAAITREVQSTARQASVNGWFSGRINVNGTIIEYRGFPLPGGGINVGTYYVP
jgi:RHS repeat-associated protein